MGYPPNFKIVTKSLTENILLASTAFQELINSILVLVWRYLNFLNQIKSFMVTHYTPQVIDVLTKFTNNTNESNLNIAYVIIPDREHNLAAKYIKKNFLGVN